MLKLPGDTCGGTCKTGPKGIGCGSTGFCAVEWGGYGTYRDQKK
jgi:hypothetical protein